MDRRKGGEREVEGCRGSRGEDGQRREEWQGVRRRDKEEDKEEGRGNKSKNDKENKGRS